MELVALLTRLWAHKLWLLLGIIVAIVALLLTNYRVSSSGLSARDGSYGAASAQFFVDSQQSAVTTLDTDTTALATRAQIIAQYAASDEVRTLIAATARVPTDALRISAPASARNAPAASAPVTPAPVPPAGVSGADVPLTITVSPDPETPVVDVSAQAPTAVTAARLAAAVLPSTAKYLDTLYRQGRGASLSASDREELGIPESVRVVLRKTAAVTSDQVATTTSKTRGFVVATATLLVWCALILAISTIRGTLREQRRLGTPGDGQTANSTD